jgi:uncharacterized tellurite resistance protein B-like protein
MLKELSERERLQLLEFICAFAWADLEVQPEEWQRVRKVIERLHIPKKEREHVLEWLVVPPDPEEIDPQSIPEEHRDIFLRAVEEIIGADHEVKRGEASQLDVFRKILGK